MWVFICGLLGAPTLTRRYICQDGAVEYTCIANSSSALLQWIAGPYIPMMTNEYEPVIISRAGGKYHDVVDSMENTIIRVQRVSAEPFTTKIAIATNLTVPETFLVTCLDIEATRSTSMSHNLASKLST